jgi:chromosome segregation ATPase
VKYISHACIKNHKNGKRAGCSGIRVKESELFRSVASALKNHINGVLDLEDILRSVEDKHRASSAKERNIQKLREQISARQAELTKIENRKVRLYEDYTEGDISRSEYASFKKNYDTQICEAETALENLKRELDGLTNEKGEHNNKWIDYFKEYQNFTEHTERSSYTEQSSVIELTREIVVKFIDRVIVYEGGGINIIFRYKDEFEQAIQALIEQGTLSALPDIADITGDSEVRT